MTAPPSLGSPGTSVRAAPATIPAGLRSGPPPDSQIGSTSTLSTLLGALAVLVATLAIPPMISGDGWFWPTTEVVLVIWLVGVGARLARVPAVGVIMLQVGAASVALTALFTVGGYGGVIPNGAVLHEATDLLTGAWEQIRTTVSPAPASTELSFLICLSVGATALIVDILIAICRAPALVALPLLCVYSVPASIDMSMLPWEAFAAPAMMYAMLLVYSGLSGRRLRTGAALAQVVSGVALASIGIVIALLVADALSGVGTAGRLPRSANGPSTGIGLAPFASLEGNLERGDPVQLLRVTGLHQPEYLRTVGLQKWTPGVGWSIDELTDGQLPDAPLAQDQTQVTISSLAYRDQFLPIYSGVASLSGVGAGWSFDSALESVHRSDAVRPDPYQVWTTFNQPSADALRADTVTPGGALTETGDLPAEVVAKANEVTAGASTAFDKADRLRAYFTTPANGFSYSLDVPQGPSGDPLVDFLRNKQGFCEQYASAMAIMLRAVGVPARVAIGFTQGVQDDNGNYLISSNDAHAWVEVLFDHAGWVEFDPTPLGGGQGRQQGFIDTAPATSAAGAVPTVGGSGLQPLNEPTLQGGSAGPLTSGATAASAGAGEQPGVSPAWWWLLATIVVVVVAAAGPRMVRGGRRRRRLAIADAGDPEAAAAAWKEIEDLAVDHGITLDAAESARACANKLARAAQLSAPGREQLRALVSAAEQGWYGRSVRAGRVSIPGGRDGDTGGAPAGEHVDAQVGPAAGNATVPGPSSKVATVDVTNERRGFGGAARTLALELAHNVPLSPIDRLVPRSVRPSWWRD